MKVSLFDREKAVTAREQRCGHRGRDSVYPGACCVRRCSLFLLQEGQTAMWTLGKTRDVSQACGPPSFSHFWLPSLLSHKGPPQHPMPTFPWRAETGPVFTVHYPTAINHILSSNSPFLSWPQSTRVSIPKGPPLAPKLPTSHLPPPSTLPPTRKNEFVVEVKSDKLPEEMALLQGSNGDKRAPGDQVGGSS